MTDPTGPAEGEAEESGGAATGESETRESTTDASPTDLEAESSAVGDRAASPVDGHDGDRDRGDRDKLRFSGIGGAGAPGATDRGDGDAAAAPEAGGTGSADRSGPLSDLAASVDREADASDSSEFDRLFERESVAEIDSDQLWERLESDRPAEELLGDDREIREIRKASYCHKCEHFADPPNVGCSREGTEILEMPTLETFRVADCPVVLEDEELERQY